MIFQEPERTGNRLSQSIPHKTTHTVFLQSVARSGPLPHPHGWCTSPSDKYWCEGPSCVAPLDWKSSQVLPCRSSLRALRLVCPTPQPCPSLSGQGKVAYCCLVSAETTPASHLADGEVGEIRCCFFIIQSSCAQYNLNFWKICFFLYVTVRFCYFSTQTNLSKLSLCKWSTV